jgi:hypothetical protein
MRRALPPDERWPGPRSVREAVEQIERTFAENRWDEAARRKYASMKIARPALPSEMTNNEVRAVHRAMVASRMILIK